MTRRRHGAPLRERELSARLCAGIARVGPRCLIVQESDRSGCTDEEVLAYAAAENRAVVTFNRRHFIKLHNTSQEHAGIIVCTFDSDFAALAARIDAAMVASPVLAQTLIRINRP